jgi:hypothetical protein
MSRIYLGLVALMLLSSAAYVVNPAAFSLNGQTLTVPGAVSDVRSIYGAFPISVGLFLLPAVFRARGHRNELRLCALLFGVVTASRVLGPMLDGGDQSFTYACMALEAVFAVAAVLLLMRDRRATA